LINQKNNQEELEKLNKFYYSGYINKNDYENRQKEIKTKYQSNFK